MLPTADTNQRQRTRSKAIKRLFIPALIVIALAAALLVSLLPRPAAPKPKSRLASTSLIAPPQFSIPGGVYTNLITVRLTASSASAVIRYTTDGSEPTPSSKKYSNPLRIDTSTLLQARTFEDTSNSVAVCQTYIRLNSDLEGFSSNLPLLIFNSFGTKIPHDKKAFVSARIIDTNSARSTLTGPADFDGRCELNIRGHTSLRYPKHSYHFKAKDEELNPLKVSVLGFPKESDWVLYAPYPDKTLMRDVLAYELSNEMGRYATRTKFVEVFVNESGGRLSQRDYLGVFVLEEKIKRGKHRVNIDKLTPEDNAEPNVTGGYIFKKDHLDTIELGNTNPEGFPTGRGRGGGGGSGYSRYSSGPGGFPGDPAGFRPSEGHAQRNSEGFFQKFGQRFAKGTFTSSKGTQFFYVEPQADEITAKQKAWLNAYVNKFESVLYGENFTDPKTGYAAYIDPGSFTDHHLLVELTKNIDGFRFSTFFYKDRGEKLTMGPIWDFNLSFGDANGKQGWMTDYWYWPQLDDQQYSWFRRLFEDPDFAQQYVDRWGELRTNQFAIARIHARIDELAALLDEAQARNFRRWRILGRFVWPNTFVGATFREEVDWMKDWIQKRIEWVDRQFVAAPGFSIAPGPVPHGSELRLYAPAGTIYYSLDGTDPRAPGGGVSASAKRFESSLLLNENTSLFCRVLQDNRWSYPALARFTVQQGK